MHAENLGPPASGGAEEEGPRVAATEEKLHGIGHEEKITVVEVGDAAVSEVEAAEASLARGSG